MLFNSVIGQELSKNQLIRSVKENRVSHALLFHGPPGCGKFPLAMAFAQYLICSDPQESDSCGVCPSCLKSQKNIHPDIHFVFPVVNGLKSSKEPVSDLFLEEWRNYLQESSYADLAGWMNFIKVDNKQAGIYTKEAELILHKLQLKSFESDHKVVIVWLPEKMNGSSANKLLKIIEEPPEKTFFLMVAESTEEIIPTILSRTQLVKINKIPDQVLENHLRVKFPEKVNIIPGITRQAGGNYIQAIKLIETNKQHQLFFENFVLWMRLSYGLKVIELLEWVPKIAQLGREKQKDFLIFCLRMISGNFHMNREVMEIMRLSQEEENFSKRFNQFVNPGNIEELNLLFSEAISQIEMNANPKITFMDMSTHLYRLLRKPVSEE